MTKHPLASLPDIPAHWTEKLRQFAYETAEDVLSTCQVENGRASLARCIGCSEEIIWQLEKRLYEAVSTPPEAFAPVEHPLGALLEPDKLGDDDV